MRWFQDQLEISTRGRGPVNVTAQLKELVQRSGIQTGLCSLFVQHTSAGVIIQENADPAVLRDMATWLAQVAPESPKWEHDDEGPDDMPAHLRTVLTRTQETIPVQGGRLALGTWQAVYLWEHRTHPHLRKIIVTVAGEGEGAERA